MDLCRVAANDFVLGIAASGTTPYVIGGIKEARKRGISTGCVACSSGSPLGEASEFPIEVVTGPEFVTGSTRMKAGTAQKMVLNMTQMGIGFSNTFIWLQGDGIKLDNNGKDKKLAVLCST